MTIAYSYLRLSRKKQTKGHGKDRQWTSALEACKEHGWLLSDITFQDLGLSAYKGEHLEEGGAFRKFLDLIHEGKITRGSVLIVENPDRISRQGVNASASLMLQILNAGVLIYTIFDKRLYRGDKDTALMDLMVWGIQAQRAFDESDTKSKRLRGHKAKQRENARNGKAGLIGKVPAWIDTVRPSKGEPYYVVNEAKADVIRQIFQLKISGLTPNEIAKQLEESGVPTWSKTVKNWSHYTIRRWLQSTTTYGQIQLMVRNELGESVPDGEPIEDFYPPVIDKETFVQAQKTMKKTIRGRVSLNGLNLFRGLARCSCGGALHVQESKTRNGRKIPYLRCSEAYTTRPCPRPAFNYEGFEYLVISAIQQIDWDSLYAHRAGSARGELEATSQALDVVSSDIAELERRTDTLLNALEYSTPDTIETLSSRLNANNLRIREMHAKKQKLTAKKEALSNVVVSTNGKDLSIGLELLYASGGDPSNLKRHQVHQKLLTELERIEVHPTTTEGLWSIKVTDIKGDLILDATINKDASRLDMLNTTFVSDTALVEIRYWRKDYRKVDLF